LRTRRLDVVRTERDGDGDGDGDDVAIRLF
jgi:hypothetical protein